jgi:predicted DNA-binding protein with PD1-like motif
MVLFPMTGFGQAGKGTLLGTVVDSSKAAIPHTAIRVTDVGTGVSRSVLSNESGNWILQPLDPGTYRVEAEHQGFTKSVRDKIRLDKNGNVHVDFTLDLAAATESVNVITSTVPNLENNRAAPESRSFRPGIAPGLRVTDLGRSSSRTYRLNMTAGDEIITGLLEFAEKNHVKNGHFTGLGAIDKATLRWSDPVNKGSKKTEINEEAEVVSLVGSISVDKDGKSAVHAHTVLALSDGTTRGGHLMSAHVSIIAEIFVMEEEGTSTHASQ